MGNANTTATSEGSGDIDQLHNINVTLVSYSQYQTILISSIFFIVTLILTVEVSRFGFKCFPVLCRKQDSWTPLQPVVAAEEGLLSGDEAECSEVVQGPHQPRTSNKVSKPPPERAGPAPNVLPKKQPA